jgi:exonuclease SbcD
MNMRFLHTADWHLGRSFYNKSLIEDQAYVLDQLVEIARDTKPELIIVSGDVYDRAIPSIDAVMLLDETLCRLVLTNDTPVILIAGNHDSPQRLQFGARLVESNKLYVFGTVPDHRKFIQMYDKWGPVCFYAMPYVEPAVARECFKDEGITDHEAVAVCWTTLVKETHPTQARSVLITHALVAGGETESESERPLALGGSGAINASCFDGFHFGALGHLHRCQTLGQGRLHYSGALLKYSFDDRTDKSVSLVEMDRDGHCRITPVPLSPKRELHCVRGDLESLLKAPPDHVARDDFVKVELQDRGSVWDPMGKLREVFPNVMVLETKQFLGDVAELVIQADHRKVDPLTLFAEFYSQVTGEPFSDEQITAFSQVVQDVEISGREASE